MRIISSCRSLSSSNLKSLSKTASRLAKTDVDKHLTKYIHYYFHSTLLLETQGLSKLNVIHCCANYFGKIKKKGDSQAIQSGFILCQSGLILLLSI